MADPFSVIAGVLGTLDASTRLASKATKIILTLKNAPSDILALANELEDLRVILDEAETARWRLEKEAVGSPTMVAALRAELNNARSQIDELGEIVDRTWEMKAQRRVTWLRKQGDIGRRMTSLRLCRERLRDLLTTHNVSVESPRYPSVLGANVLAGFLGRGSSSSSLRYKQPYLFIDKKLPRLYLIFDRHLA